MTPRTRLQDFTDEGTVRVLSKDVDGHPIEGGSGFFVAPGVIVTCAHVVSRGGRAVSRVKVQWNEVTYDGTALARPQIKGEADIWDPPDLCVITLDRKPVRQPSVVLAELRDADRHELYIAGYNRVYDRTSVQFQSKSTGVLGGSQRLAGENVREIVGVEIARGMSGGPVLDMRRGTVCGVIKTQRSENDDRGGLFIPAEFIRREFMREAWLPNERVSEANSEWLEQRDAVLDEVNPVLFRLDAQGRDLLVRVAAELSLATEDFTRSWGDITEFPAPRAFTSLNDLISDLADRTWNGLDPITKLFVWLSYRDGVSPGSAGELAGYATLRALRQGQDRASLVQYEKSILERKSAPQSPVLVVRLRPDPPASTRAYIIDIWRYADREAVQHPVVNDRGPYPLPVARSTIIKILQEQIRLLDGRPIIEFALPDNLLDHPVEEWNIGGGVPLGEKYPVVVRLAEREIDGISYVGKLKFRATEFKRGAVPPRGTQGWDDLWLTCQSQYTPRGLNRVLQQSRIPMIAMTAWHGRQRALKAIRTVKEAGIAVVVWRHKQCGEGACSAGGQGGACPGIRFKQDAADHVAGEGLVALPDKIFAARIRQPDKNGALGYQSPGIALIWDDPDLLPWEPGSPNVYPIQPAGWDDVEQLANLYGSRQPAPGHPPAAPATGVAGIRPDWIPCTPGEP